MYTLGIDIGTTSVCGVVFDIAHNRVVQSVNRRNDSGVPSEPDCFVQNPDRIMELVLAIANELFDAFPVKAVGVTGQMHGIVYTDKQGHSVSPLITWKDKRGDRPYDKNRTYAGYLSDAAGYSFYSGYGTVSHFYCCRNDLRPREAAYIMSIADYAVWQLSGSSSIKIDASMAAGMGGFNLEKNCFDRDALCKAGVEVDCLPPVLEAGEERTMGYYRNIPVYAAFGDNQASFLAAVEDFREGVCINVGTGSQVSVYNSTLYQTEYADIRPFLGKGFLYVGASLNGGKAYALLGEFYREICEQFAGVKVDTYEIMNRLGLECRETGGLTFAPLFYGARGHEGSAAAITGLNPNNFHVPEFTKALVHGMAEELYLMYLSFPKELQKGRKQIYAGGNGMRRNVLLQREVEMVFGLPVKTAVLEEEAAAGAAILAAGRRDFL